MTARPGPAPDPPGMETLAESIAWDRWDRDYDDPPDTDD